MSASRSQPLCLEANLAPQQYEQISNSAKPYGLKDSETKQEGVVFSVHTLASVRQTIKNPPLLTNTCSRSILYSLAAIRSPSIKPTRGFLRQRSPELNSTNIHHVHTKQIEVHLSNTHLRTQIKPSDLELKQERKMLLIGLEFQTAHLSCLAVASTPYTDERDALEGAPRLWRRRSD